MHTTDLLTVSEVAHRSGFAASALRFYEREGLLSATRTSGGQRRYQRSVLRRLAFIAAAQRVGLSLAEIAATLATLPADRPPSKRDWARLSRAWREDVEERIALLERVRDDLASCIGCGCLSLKTCGLLNPGDEAAALGVGARYLRQQSARLDR